MYIIATEEEYRNAVIRFLAICDASPESDEFSEALELAKAMEQYEMRITSGVELN